MYVYPTSSHYQTLQSGLSISAFPQTPMECSVNAILELEGEQGKIEIDRNWYYFFYIRNSLIMSHYFGTLVQYST